jgi:ATP-dependent DNA helicase RecG
MLNHGLDQPLLSTDTGYFQVTFAGPGDSLDRIHVAAPALGMIVTPAIGATLNERQKKMVALLVAGEKLTSRRCEQEFRVTRDAAAKVLASYWNWDSPPDRGAAAQRATSLLPKGEVLFVR